MGGALCLLVEMLIFIWTEHTGRTWACLEVRNNLEQMARGTDIGQDSGRSLPGDVTVPFRQ